MLKQQFIAELRNSARRLKKTIILPESTDARTLDAASKIIKRGLAKIILVGNSEQIRRKARFQHINLEGVEIRDSKSDDLETGLKLLAKGDADGLVAGAAHSTKELYKAAFKIIGTKEKGGIASTFFIMLTNEKQYLFADCALNIEPNETELATIALDTAKSAKDIGMIPKVALLSYSTKGSAEHKNLDKTRTALKIIKKENKKLFVDGEVQVDAAIVPAISQLKNPGSPIRGNANVLIFPDLNSGNIAYKLVERLAGATAIGPITQGLKKPVNDLSRGCNAEDIINSVCITALLS